MTHWRNALVLLLVVAVGCYRQASAQPPDKTKPAEDNSQSSQEKSQEQIIAELKAAEVQVDAGTPTSENPETLIISFSKGAFYGDGERVPVTDAILERLVRLRNVDELLLGGTNIADDQLSY